jgi:hypothetical protein
MVSSAGWNHQEKLYVAQMYQYILHEQTSKKPFQLAFDTDCWQWLYLQVFEGLGPVHVTFNLITNQLQAEAFQVSAKKQIWAYRTKNSHGPCNWICLIGR